MINKTRRQEIWKKLRFMYRISATNENTLEEIWRFKTSIFWGLLLFLVFAIMIIIFTSAVIITTPIRNYLPGYLDTEVRDKALQTSIQMEALEQQVTYQETYINNLRDVFLGVRDVDSVKIFTADTLGMAANNDKLVKTDREKKFVENYEEDEMYNLSILVNEVDLPMSGTAFYKPVKGLIIESFNMAKSHYGIKIGVQEKETILAALEGTVIFAGYSASEGYIVQVQHNNGFVSVYKHNTMLMVKVGEQVATGQALAVVESKRDNKEEDLGGAFVSFELWYRGKPVNPQNYIYF